VYSKGGTFMGDMHNLFIALSNMDAEEGTPARNSLVWNVIRNNLDSSISDRANRLSARLKEDQEKNGSKHPLAGELIAAEILAKVGMLLNEKEEGDG
jgi:hypothetical protein